MKKGEEHTRCQSTNEKHQTRIRESKTYVGAFWSPLSFLPMLSIQDDIAAALTGDLGAGLVFERGEGSNVGLGVSRKDVLTSSDGGGFGDEVRALAGVMSSTSVVNAREFRLCT